MEVGVVLFVGLAVVALVANVAFEVGKAEGMAEFITETETERERAKGGH
jgi:hypothetical protein